MHYASYRGRDCILINNWKRLITFPSTIAVGRTEENKARTQQRESVWVHSLLEQNTGILTKVIHEIKEQS